MFPLKIAPKTWPFNSHLITFLLLKILNFNSETAAKDFGITPLKYGLKIIKELYK